MRDKHYDIFAQRLSKENIDWLKQLREDSESWNLVFNYLRELHQKYAK